MDASKAWTLLVTLLLIVCLTLSVTALVSLRHAVEESRVLREEANRLTARLDECIDVWQNKTAPEEDSIPTVGEIPESKSSYLIRRVGQKIGIYNNEDILIRLLDVEVGLLPRADREALALGIEVPDWNQVLSFIEDYTA